MQIILNNISYNIKEENSLNLTIYQFCFSKGINLPCFCYHEKLSIAGNCRMCLVEANNALLASCAVPIVDEMNIITESRRITYARSGVLEFLLINHPLDCPICDQGGECDLQDITVVFGSDRGRFYESKRAVDNINCLGPLIKTVMTRCIHCTRCIRFLNEYSNIFDLGILGRGNAMEIGSYIERFIEDEIWANIIDLCPVGALTSMPYAFTARPWELMSIETIDILDSMASSIRLDVVNNQVVRVLPVLNETLNEEWLTNKARFSYDALSLQRLYYPKLKIINNFIVISWVKALKLFIDYIFDIELKNIEAICGPFLDLETGLLLKYFFNSFGCSNIFYQGSSLNLINTDFRFMFLFNSKIIDLEEANFVLLIATNLRLENPLLNMRLRKNYIKRGPELIILSFGLTIDYSTYPVLNIGNSFSSLFRFFEGKHTHCSLLLFNGFKKVNIFPSLLKVWNYKSCRNFEFVYDDVGYAYYKKPINPYILVGSSIYNRIDSKNVINATSWYTSWLLNYSYSNIDKNKTYYNIISDSLGRLTSLELGFNKLNRTKIEQKSLYYFLGAADLFSSNLNTNSFVISQTYFAPVSTEEQFINLLLPVSTYSERVSTYLNMEGRIRLTKIAVTPYKSVLSDLEIIRILMLLKRKYYSSNLSILNNFHNIMSFFSNFINYNCCFFSRLSLFLSSSVSVFGFSLRKFYNLTGQWSFDYYKKVLELRCIDYKLKFNNSIYSTLIYNYYNSDIFVRNSKIMSLCSSRLYITNFSKKYN